MGALWESLVLCCKHKRNLIFDVIASAAPAPQSPRRGSEAWGKQSLYPSGGLLTQAPCAVGGLSGRLGSDTATCLQQSKSLVLFATAPIQPTVDRVNLIDVANVLPGFLKADNFQE